MAVLRLSSYRNEEMEENNGVKEIRKLGWVLYISVCVLYILSLAYILFFRTKFWVESDYWTTIRYHVNLIPLQTIREYRNTYEHYPELAVENILGNLFLFLPLGVIFCERKIRFYKSFLFSAILIAAIELIQLFSLRGICDIDDWILNLLGMGIGYLLTYGMIRILAALNKNIFSVRRERKRRGR